MSVVPLLSMDSPGVTAVNPPQWGLFYQSNGDPVIVAESVHHVEYSRDYQISDYPQEQGAYESYNKVQDPFTAGVGFLISESRRNVLGILEAIAKSLNLVTVITPEIFYPSANVIGYRYRREARAGVTLILVEVMVREVRISGGQQVSSSAGQTQPTAGTDRPVGTTSPLAVGGALDTGSTNGAYPQTTGQVQPAPAASTPTATPLPTPDLVPPLPAAGAF